MENRNEVIAAYLTQSISFLDMSITSGEFSVEDLKNVLEDLKKDYSRQQSIQAVTGKHPLEFDLISHQVKVFEGYVAFYSARVEQIKKSPQIQESLNIIKSL